jgi:hypothetical protein
MSSDAPKRWFQRPKDNPQALRDRCRIAPPPLSRGNIIERGAQRGMKNASESQPSCSSLKIRTRESTLLLSPIGSDLLEFTVLSGCLPVAKMS